MNNHDDEIIRLENINKSYGNINAIKNITMSVRENEIVGLVGDNGAGKSTIAKMIAGEIQPNSGRIYFKGKKVSIKNTRDAIKLGVESIYQNSALVEQLSVSRNIFLGREPVIKKSIFFKFLKERYMNYETLNLLKMVGIKNIINPNTTVGLLSGGERQSIAIARARFFESSLIVLDEPTNNLGVQESREVLKFILDAKKTNHSIIFITHNIYHVFKVVDRVIILRHGKLVGNMTKQETTREEIEELIIGSIDKRISNI